MISFIAQYKPTRAQAKDSFFPGAKPKTDQAKAPAPSDSFIPGARWKEHPEADQAGKVDSSKTGQPAPSLDSLSAAQSAALAALPAAPAAALKFVWDTLDSKPVLQGQLLDLLGNGTLGKEQDGKTTVEGLKELHTQPRMSGLSGSYVTEQTISILADPEKNIRQGTNSTCGAAALEYQLTTKPALFVETVKNLTGASGRATLPSGASIARITNLAEDDKSLREPVNRIVQDAFMQAAGSPNHGDYDPVQDQFADGDKGLRSLDIARQAANMENREMAVIAHDSSTDKLFRDIFNQLPENTTTHVGAYWGEKDHMLVYKGQKDGVAHFFNSDDKSLQEIPVDKFLFKTQLAIFPADLVHPTADQFPDEKVYFVQPDQPSVAEG